MAPALAVRGSAAAAYAVTSVALLLILHTLQTSPSVLT